MSSVRIRFVFNRRQGKMVQETHRFENFSRALVREVAFKYSEGLYTRLKAEIASRIHSDIDKELDHMAGMFMYSVIGVSGRSLGPKGNLTTFAPPSSAMRAADLTESVRGLTGNWPRRSKTYLASRYAGDEWFHRNGAALAKMASAKTWTHAYGGVAVTIRRVQNFKSNDVASAAPYTSAGLLKGTRAGNARIGVATIQVDAMRRITTHMLPALAEGASLKDYGDNPRGVGLLSMLGEQVAWRLGGNPRTVPFRPTVQPFLAFFIKRQLPNAVFKRLEQGLAGARLTDGTGSAGRAQGEHTKERDFSVGDYRPKR